MSEIFLPVVGYEGLYTVSNYGRIYSIKKCKCLRPKSNGRRYLQIELTKDKKHKMLYVHRLVAEAFLENPHDLKEVNHKDENSQNNCVDNLEWCSKHYNLLYGTRVKRTSSKRKKPVLQTSMDGRVIRRFNGLSDVEKEYGYSHANISNCCNGKILSSYGYKWKFA